MSTLCCSRVLIYFTCVAHFFVVRIIEMSTKLLMEPFFASPTNKNQSSVTDHAVRSVLTKLHNELPSLTSLIRDHQRQPQNQSIDNAIRNKLTDMNRRIHTVENLVDDNVRFGQATMNSLARPVELINIEQELMDGQSRFETTTELAKHTQEIYYKQQKVMWLWIFFAILLGAGAVYFYIWVHGRHENVFSLANPPPAKEWADTQMFSPSGKTDDVYDGSKDLHEEEEDHTTETGAEKEEEEDFFGDKNTPSTSSQPSAGSSASFQSAS